MTSLLTVLQSYGSLLAGRNEEQGSLSLEPIDTKKPLDIIEEEELERISSLLQRENLVKGLGIVEHVYRLLHCTPGTMSMQAKTDLSRFQQVIISITHTLARCVVLMLQVVR